MTIKGPVECSLCGSIVELTLTVTEAEFEAYKATRKWAQLSSKLAAQKWVMNNNKLMCPACTRTPGTCAGPTFKTSSW